MQVTTRHPKSCHGVPVILSDAGKVITYADGIRLAMGRLGWDKQTLAYRTGASIRTVEGWLQGRMPLVSALNVLRDALDGAG